MTRPSRSALCLAVSAILATQALPLAAEPASTHYVSNTLDAGPGSLRAAIAAANASAGVADIVEFDPELIGETILIESTLTVTDTLTIAAPGLITIRGDASHGAFRLFSVDDGTATLRTLRLELLVLENGAAHATGSGAAAMARGGAIYSREQLELLYCTISGNQATAENHGFDAYADGGAIAVYGAPLYMVGTNVTDNVTVAKVLSGAGTANASGPIWVSSESSQPSYFIASVISGNATTGIAAIDDARASGSRVSGALSVGGGTSFKDNNVYALASDYALAVGGGLGAQTSFQDYDVDFSDCVVSGNSVHAKATAGDAKAEAGGLFIAHLAGGGTTIQRCTVADNSVRATAEHAVDGAGTVGDVNADADASAGGLSLDMFVGGSAWLIDSTVSGNQVIATALADHAEQAYMSHVGAVAHARAIGGALFASTINAAAPTPVFVMLNSTISGNTQQADADSYADSSLEVVTSASSDAQARGALYLLSEGSLGNSSIVDNHSIADGSATATAAQGAPEIENTSLLAESGGVHGASSNALLLYSNLIAQNTVLAASGTSFAPDLQGTFLSPEHNLVSDPTGSNIVNGVAGNIVTAVPQVAPLANNGGPTLTHALLPAVAAIDAGVNPYGLDGDQRGYLPREVNGGTDIGAFELGAEQSEQIFTSGFD